MSLSIPPKKSLGQNFLTSSRVIDRIVSVIPNRPNQSVLEIGPGMGAITEKLITLYDQVIAVEKDTRLYTYLIDRFTVPLEQKKLSLIHGDILEFDPEPLLKTSSSYVIIANIPYNITGFIFRKFLSGIHQPTDMVVLIQKEVATRILAKDNKHSLLSLSVHVYGVPKLITHVSRGNFNPSPRVDSSVIHIEQISKKRFVDDNHEKIFFDLIHAGFSHKRKVAIKNFLDHTLGEKSFWEKVFNDRGLSIQSRAEDLSVDDWIFITCLVYTQYYGKQ